MTALFVMDVRAIDAVPLIRRLPTRRGTTSQRAALDTFARLERRGRTRCGRHGGADPATVPVAAGAGQRHPEQQRQRHLRWSRSPRQHPQWSRSSRGSHALDVACLRDRWRLGDEVAVRTVAIPSTTAAKISPMSLGNVEYEQGT